MQLREDDLLCNLSTLVTVDMFNSCVPFIIAHKIHLSILHHFFQRCSWLRSLVVSILASTCMFGLLCVNLKKLCSVYIFCYGIICFLL
jgi:hypothetical protein